MRAFENLSGTRAGFASLIILLWFFLLAPITAHAEWPEQSCSFAHRIPVTITAGAAGHNTETKITLVSADFPASYTLSAAGDDVRIFESDDVTPVDFIITGWDSTARTATIYVRLPAMTSSTSETIHVYVGDSGLPSGNNATAVFPDIGVRLRSRVSTSDPVSAADALTAFEAATVDVYDAVRTNVSGINNRSLGDYPHCLNVFRVVFRLQGFFVLHPLQGRD